MRCMRRMKGMRWTRSTGSDRSRQSIRDDVRRRQASIPGPDDEPSRVMESIAKTRFFSCDICDIGHIVGDAAYG